MPSLKDLKNRIKSVRNTQKITKAMKMVAAAKLRRAKDAAEAARPYAEALSGMLENLAASQGAGGNHFPLLSGRQGAGNTHLLIIATSDRGLCGGFNSTIVRSARRRIRELKAEGRQVKLYFIGRKGYEQLAQEYGSLAVAKAEIGRGRVIFSDAERHAAEITRLFEAGEFDVASIVYNRFKSAISQLVTWQQLVPLLPEGAPTEAPQTAGALYEYEPSEKVILDELLPRNLAVQLYKALLENAASEQGARMTAMDNATRNAGDMIKKLNLKYNRSRQAAITKELIEIISGAEAV